MFWVVTNNIQLAIAFYDLALRTALSNGWRNFHFNLLLRFSYLMPKFELYIYLIHSSRNWSILHFRKDEWTVFRYCHGVLKMRRE